MGVFMYYIDLNAKQKTYIYDRCSVKHVCDTGLRSILYRNMELNCSFINTFATNFIETPCNSNEGIYSWEYDVIYVPIKYANTVNRLLNPHNYDIIQRR